MLCTHFTVIYGAIQQRGRSFAVHIPALQSSPQLRLEFHIHSLVPLHLRLLSHRVGGLLPDVVVGGLSLWPHKLELEFAFVVFALVVECVQDTVVRVSGFRRIHAQPLVRWLQEIRTSLTDQQFPSRLSFPCCRRFCWFLCCGRFCRLRFWCVST